MARPTNEDGLVRWRVNLPADLAARVELHLLDPFLLRVGYGKRSALVEQLLRQWLQQQQQEKAK